LKRHLRRYHRSPAQAMEPAGRDPGRAFGAPRSGTTDALFPEEVQSFPDKYFARLGQGSGKAVMVLRGAKSHARQAERLTSFMAASRANHAERESRLQPTLKPNHIS
jgi:hypothetical protein